MPVVSAVLQLVIDTGKLAPYDILLPDEELAPEEVKQVSNTCVDF